jgi:hypothetical protein
LKRQTCGKQFGVYRFSISTCGKQSVQWRLWQLFRWSSSIPLRLLDGDHICRTTHIDVS